MNNEHSIPSTLYNDLPPHDKNQVLTLLFRQEDNLRSLYFDAVERSIKTLFLLNAGGVVTILAYIYKQSSSCSKSLLSISLFFFLIGLLLALLVVFLEFRRSYSAHTIFFQRVTEYFANRIPYKDINQYKVIDPNYIIWIGYISAFCIPLGILFGIVGYLI